MLASSDTLYRKTGLLNYPPSKVLEYDMEYTNGLIKHKGLLLAALSCHPDRS